MLSVQAQLTDNSYIFSHDCQLTGGFAFFVWYPQGQFVLTLGGYNPAFAKPPQFPEVPRLGFNWSVGEFIVIKGGCYFALTEFVRDGRRLAQRNRRASGRSRHGSTCTLTSSSRGTPLRTSSTSASRSAHRSRSQVCFFGVRQHRHHDLTRGTARNRRAAFPRDRIDRRVRHHDHGLVRRSARAAAIHHRLGCVRRQVPDRRRSQPAAPSRSSSTPACSPPTRRARNRSREPRRQPWQVGIEFSFTTTTRMPATATSDFVFGASADPIAGLNGLDVAPMDLLGGEQHTHRDARAAPGRRLVAGTELRGELRAARRRRQHFTVTAATGLFPEATWHWTDPQHLPAAARTISAVAGLKVERTWCSTTRAS